MTNKPRRVGTDWEMRVLALLRVHGIDAHRNPPAGNLDVGDLRFTDRDGDAVVVECKATKAIDLAGGMNELAVETARADAAYGVLVVKRRSHPTGRAYAVLELADFAALVAPEEA